jgi:hypothetical protein
VCASHWVLKTQRRNESEGIPRGADVRARALRCPSAAWPHPDCLQWGGGRAYAVRPERW